MKKHKKENNVRIYIITGIFLVIAVLFYLRQQYIIIKLQKEINNLYEQLLVERNRNKELVLTFQALISTQRLQNYAKKLNFVPVKQNDYIFVE